MSAIDQINQGGTTYEIVPEIAELFSIEKTYRAGDHVIYEAGWYTFKADKYAGAWDATKVDGPFKVTNQISELKEDLNQKANIDGSYESMTVGNAEQLVSTVFTDDNEPYNFRTAGGNADIGDRLYEKIVGVSLPWNQLSDNSRESAEVNGITYTNNGDGSITANGTATATASFNSIEHAGVTAVVGHVYLVKGCPSGGNGSAYYVQEPFTGGSNNIDTGNGRVIKRENTSTRILAQIVIANGTTVNNLVFKPQLFDLTAMFGPTIADYIYSLETANAGAGVAWFKKLFPKDYYAYDAGSLQSVQAAKHVTVGFNQWDEEWEVGAIAWASGQKAYATDKIRSKNFISVIPEATYYIKAPAGKGINLFYYDANKSFIRYESSSIANAQKTMPSDAHFVMFFTVASYGTTYKHDICISLHWDGERDGEYEAYNKHEYPLADLTLRGIPKLDASNHLYYDGDTYESDGTVTRNFVNKVFVGAAIGEYWFLQSINEHDIANFGFGLSPDKYITGVSLDTIVRSNWYGDKVQTTAIANTSEEGILFASGDTFYVRVSSSKASTVDAFKAYLAEHPLEIVYKLATPTTEEAAPFQSPQVVDDFGTEEYVDAGVTASTPTRDVAIPVGHESQYSANLRAKLEMAPDSPSDGDGDYLVRQTSGENEYVKYVSPVPALPSEDGTYTLKVTVSGSTKTVAWVADT